MGLLNQMGEILSDSIRTLKTQIYSTTLTQSIPCPNPLQGLRQTSRRQTNKLGFIGEGESPLQCDLNRRNYGTFTDFLLCGSRCNYLYRFSLVFIIIGGVMKNICRCCGDEYPMARWELGYKFCIECGIDVALAVTASRCVVPMHKSNYMLVTNKDDLIGINNKGGLTK